MLRLLALVLLLANGLYFAWGNGLLLAYGLGPAQQGEPQHMAQQIAPASIKLLKPEEFKQLEEQVKAEREPKECMEAGPFDATQAAVLRQSLADALPAAVWALEEVHIVPRWIVYLGKYANAEALAKKRVEIAAMNLSLEPLENPALEPGLSLGGYGTKAEADAALVRLSARGLHTAHVLQERAESTGFQLKLPVVGVALKPKLDEIRAMLGGKPLAPCAK